MDKAGKKYWDTSWSSPTLPKVVNPNDKANSSTYVEICLHQYFSEVFSKEKISEKKLLEIGCARSKWLPYFAKQFNLEVTGIDYSEIGCDQAKEILSIAEVKGEIICADFFSPPQILLEKFDVIVSFGVIEHFENTTVCIEEFCKFLKPNGIIISIIPNLVGMIGWIQKHINKPVFDIHVPLDRETFILVHQKAGLETIDCNYFMSTNFGVCNLNGIKKYSLKWIWKKMLLYSLVRLSQLVWKIENIVGKFPANSLTSPLIICVARKK